MTVGAAMRRILITGGAGFIGSNFIHYLLKHKKGVEYVVNLDVLTYAGNLENLADVDLDSCYYFVKGNICDKELVEKLFCEYDFDTVVHFAAESHVDRSIVEPEIFLTTNVVGTQTLLDAAKRHWKVDPEDKYSREFRPGVRYLQVSTDEVYGALGKKGMFRETTPLSPNSPYSASKASADLLVRAYHQTYGMPVNITRCSNNYGPYHFPEKLIPLIIKNILAGQKLPVYGKGDNVRDWLYVEDHAKAIDAVLERGRIGEVYNVGGFNEEQNINIVKLIIGIIARIMREEPEYRRVLKTDVKNINEDLITFVGDRPGHDMRYAIDPSKIARELGWYPETPFTVGIEKTVRWYLDHQDWVDEVVSGDYQKYYEQMYGNR